MHGASYSRVRYLRNQGASTPTTRPVDVLGQSLESRAGKERGEQFDISRHPGKGTRGVVSLGLDHTAIELSGGTTGPTVSKKLSAHLLSSQSQGQGLYLGNDTVRACLHNGEGPGVQIRKTAGSVQTGSWTEVQASNKHAYSVRSSIHHERHANPLI
jgi:hypothetical protein